MATEVLEVIAPTGLITYTVGVNNVTRFQIKYYFANVVDVYVFFSDGSKIRYLQCPIAYGYFP